MRDKQLFVDLSEAETLDVLDLEPGAVREGVGEAMRAREIGSPAVWTDGIVTVSVYGGSRVYDAWPQSLAKVTISVPTGDDVEVSGEDITSWDDLNARVEEARDAWITEAGAHLSATLRAHQRLAEARAAALGAQHRRDEWIRETLAAGVSGYRIAKVLGISEAAVAKIRGGGQ